jgi:uncharacterized protein (DUF427 family)
LAELTVVQSEAEMAVPQKNHPIRIEPNRKRVRVLWGGKVVADTTRALTLFEASYPGVQYIPRDDADMTLLTRTTHKTHCPYKGDASYYSVKIGDRIAENAVWTYETPIPGVAEIAGYLAFYPNRVDGIEETTAD